MKKKRLAKFKSRNFVAKNSQCSGAGVHKDKKYNFKLGILKHKTKVDLK